MKYLFAFVFLLGASAEAFSTAPSCKNQRRSALHSTKEFGVSTTETTRAKPKAPKFDEVCETTGVTLTRFMNEVAMLNPEISELTTVCV